MKAKQCTIMFLAPVIFGLTPFLGGCANPINARTAQNYYAAGSHAERAGDLALARRNFSRAYGNAQLGNLGPAAEASYLYEYARVTGYAGNHVEAESSFKEVLTLIAKAKGEADRLLPPTLAEYSRLLHDTGQHQKAVPIYERAVAALDKASVESDDPVGYAALLDEFAESLRAAEQPARAAEITARSAALKAAHPGATPNFTPRRYRG